MDKLAILRKMVEENPESGYSWYLLGAELAAENQHSAALQAFSEAMKYADDSLRANVFTELGKLAGGQSGEKAQGQGDVQQNERTEGDKAKTQLYGEDETARKSGSSEGRDISSKSETVLSKGVPVDRDSRSSLNEGWRDSGFVEEDGYRDDESYRDEEGYRGEENSSGGFESDTARGSNVAELSKFRVLPGGKGPKGSEAKQSEPEITFVDVGGLDELKKTIEMKIIKPFVNPGLFARFKKKVGGGILLYGPPGCGKTYIAKATAGECGAKFITVHISDILDPYIGVSEQNVKSIFERARANKPCIIFFDEIDALGYNRAKLSSHHMRPTIDQILEEIEGIDTSTEQLLIFGATNMPWDVDPAFKRPGRFDKMVFVAPPDAAAREVIFKLKVVDRPVDSLDFAKLAKETELYSGADIENVVEVATANVIEEIMQTGVERPIGMKDLLAAIAGTKPSTIEWLKTIKNYVKFSNQAGLYDDVEEYLGKYKKLI